MNRELQVEVHMSPAQFVSVSKWMAEHADKFKKAVSKKKTTESGTPYIG